MCIRTALVYNRHAFKRSCMPPPAGPSWYLDQIGRVPLLTAAQEIELGNAVQAWLTHPDGPDACPAGIRRRGKRAKDQMIRANLRLVVSIVQRRRPNPDEFMDLVQAGNLGLIRAVELFDPTRGYKFSTYSYWWIKQGISRHLETATKTIRLPTTEYERLNKIWAATRSLTQLQGREPSRAEIAHELGMPVDKLNDILQRSRPCTSLDQLCVEDGSTLAELIPTEEPEPDPVDPRLELLQQAIGTLSDQAADVLCRVWGLGGPPQRVSEIAKELGLSMREVQQLKRHAESTLRLLTTDAPTVLSVVVTPIEVGEQAELGIEVEPVEVMTAQSVRKPRRHHSDEGQLSLPVTA